MNSIRPLTPFERGQAAFADAVCHVDYPRGSDELMQWSAGLSAAADGWGVAVDATLERAASREAELRAQLVAAHDQAALNAVLIASLQLAMQGMVEEMGPIIVAHVKGDDEGLLNALVTFTGRRVKVVNSAAGSLQ